MADRKVIKASKFLSYVLRHDPGSIGLELEDGGWVDVAELIRCASEGGVSLTEEVIEDVLSAGGKQRFSLNEDGSRLRANYGHSVPVELEMEPCVPPRTLYHGTATRFLNLIFHQGVTPRRRQFVHLSADRETAAEVGRRHGEPVVLVVDSGRMSDEGAEFFVAPDDIWLTKSIPVEFIGFEGSREGT
jgi:putative RNA 2'-phosphotransferase